MSALEQASDILPIKVTVDDQAVKEAVIIQVAQEVCLYLHQHFPKSTFDVSEDCMKQALASGLISTQQKVIANPPTFVKITKKYQRHASTPALNNNSSLTKSVSGASGRAGSQRSAAQTLLNLLHPAQLAAAWGSMTS